MGRTLYCDCCGQDIRNGCKFYAVQKVKNYTCSKWFKMEYETEEYMICGDCFAEIGKKVQEKNREIEIDVKVEAED